MVEFQENTPNKAMDKYMRLMNVIIGEEFYKINHLCDAEIENSRKTKEKI